MPVGKLRDLGKEGKLTSKTLARGLLKQSGKLQAEFERMPLTFSRSMTMLYNATGDVVHRLNKATRAAEGFFKVTKLIVDNFDEILKAAAALAGAALLGKITAAVRAMGGAAGLLRGSLSALMPWIKTLGRALAVATAIYYVFDDITGWATGADSLLGRIIGPMSEWAWLVDAVKGGLGLIKEMFTGTAQGLDVWLSKWGLIAVIIGGVIAAIGLVPAAITAGIVAAAALFNYLRQNWTAIGDYVLNLWARIKDAISGAVPDWMKRGYSAVTNFATGADSAMKSWAMPSTMPGGTTSIGGASVTNNVTTNVTATSPQPAAIGEAASRGAQRGMGPAMVPQVEASR